MEGKRLKLDRHMKKALTWNLSALLITLIISILVTRRLDQTFKIGIGERCIKLVAYYLHEKVWYKRR